MATSLEILKKNSDLSSTPKTFSYGETIAKIAHAPLAGGLAIEVLVYLTSVKSL